MVRVRRDESGAVMVIVAMLLPVLLGIASLSIDLGFARVQREREQFAVDAAALAGAGDPSLAVPIAQAYVKDNYHTSPPLLWDTCGGYPAPVVLGVTLVPHGPRSCIYASPDGLTIGVRFPPQSTPQVLGGSITVSTFAAARGSRLVG